MAARRQHRAVLLPRERRPAAPSAAAQQLSPVMPASRRRLHTLGRLSGDQSDALQLLARPRRPACFWLASRQARLGARRGRECATYSSGKRSLPTAISGRLALTAAAVAAAAAAWSARHSRPPASREPGAGMPPPPASFELEVVSRELIQPVGEAARTGETLLSAYDALTLTTVGCEGWRRLARRALACNGWPQLLSMPCTGFTPCIAIREACPLHVLSCRTRRSSSLHFYAGNGSCVGLSGHPPGPTGTGCSTEDHAH